MQILVIGRQQKCMPTIYTHVYFPKTHNSLNREGYFSFTLSHFYHPLMIGGGSIGEHGVCNAVYRNIAIQCPTPSGAFCW